jgi:hypothetical protein
MEEKKELNLVADIRGSIITEELIKSNEIYGKGYLPYYARRRMDRCEGDDEELVNEFAIRVEYTSMRSYKNRIKCSRHHLARLVEFVKSLGEDTVDERTVKYMGKELIIYYFCNIMKSKVFVPHKRVAVTVEADTSYTIGMPSDTMMKLLNYSVGNNKVISDLISLIMSLDTTNEGFKDLLAALLIIGEDKFISIFDGTSIVEKIVTYILMDSKVNLNGMILVKYPEECTVAATLLTKSHCRAYEVEVIPPEIIGKYAKALIRAGFNIFSDKHKSWTGHSFARICEECMSTGGLSAWDIESQILNCDIRLPIEELNDEKFDGIVTPAVLYNYRDIKVINNRTILDNITTNMHTAYAMCNMLDRQDDVNSPFTDAVTGKLLDIVINNIEGSNDALTTVIIDRVIGYIRNLNLWFWTVGDNMEKIYEILSNENSPYSRIIMEAIAENSRSFRRQIAFQVSNEMLEKCYARTKDKDLVLRMVNMYTNFDFVRDNYGKMFMELPATVSFSMYVHMYDENGFHRGVMCTDDTKNVFQWIKQHLSKENISQLIFPVEIMRSNKEFFSELIRVHNVDRFIDAYGINFVEELTDISISDLVRSGSYDRCGKSTFIRYLDIVLLDEDLRRILLKDYHALMMFDNETISSVLACETFNNSIKCDVLYHVYSHCKGTETHLKIDDIEKYLYGAGEEGYRLLALMGSAPGFLSEKLDIYKIITSGIVNKEEKK